MENTKNSEYFKNIADKSSDRISTEFDFSPFEQVNIYLTKQVLYQRPKDLTLCAFHGEFEVIQ